MQKVDYRNRYSISNVKIGDVIGKIIPGKVGRDGIRCIRNDNKKKNS